jgi:AraC family transcriptional regulator
VQITPALAEAMATIIVFRTIAVAGERGPLRPTEHIAPLSARQLTLIEQYIDERLDGTVMLSELAAVLELSTWHFMRRFQASCGVSPHSFLVQRRLARAQQLLQDGQHTITEIALEIGMTHSHFSRTFLKHIGVSPREYRRQASRRSA